MLIVKGEHYYNDYTRESIVLKFKDLDYIYDWIKTTSNNFSKNVWFPVKSPTCHITIHDHYNRGYVYWFHQIENENGIIFSDGRYTQGMCHWANKVKDWCIESDAKMNETINKPNFVEWE